MKRIFTLLLGTLFSLSLLAYDGTRLTVNTVSNNKMSVEIDGRRYNMDRSNTLSLRDLSAGRHTIRIFFESKKNNSIFSRNRQHVVYNQTIQLRRDHHLDITINRFGKVLVDERRIDRNDDWYDDDDNWDRDNRRDDRRNDDRWDNNNGRQISGQEFEQAKETLRREWLESSRVTVARQIIDRNYFSSQQIREMLQLFSFENNKLDLAKHAYGKATDRRNYHIVNDVFAYSNSRDELARYIRDYR